MATPINPQAMEETNFVIEIDIRIQQLWYQSHQGNIQLRENIRIPAADFLALAQILGQFHDLAKRIEAGNGSSPKDDIL